MKKTMLMKWVTLADNDSVDVIEDDSIVAVLDDSGWRHFG